jgi:hypothetical protein
MSVGDGERPVTALPGIEAIHGPLVFQIRLFADGHLDFKLPNGPDPIQNEVLFRGWLDKCREAILDHFKGGQRIVS